MKNTATHHHHHHAPALARHEQLDKATIRRLSQLKPWLSTAHLFLEYVFIFSAILLVNQFRNPILYVLAVMWIGARQHAMAIMLHEASHYRIVKNKKLNDLLGEVFLAFPLFVTVHSYRLSHMAHHRHTNTSFDPDWVSKETPEWEFPKTRKELFFILAKILMGMNAFWMIKLIFSGGRSAKANEASVKKEKKASRYFVAGRISYYVGLIAVLSYFGLWLHFLLFWIVPLFTWLQVILRIRSIAEHFGLDYDHTFTSSRTTYPSVFDRIFLVSKNVWFHLDHHLYPSVPFYNLPALHQELQKIPSFKEKAHITQSYYGVLMECTNDRITHTQHEHGPALST